MIRLAAFLEADWDAIDAEYPETDVLRLPFRKLLNMLYIRNAQSWARSEAESRPPGMLPTYAEFDHQLNMPFTVTTDEPTGEDEFYGDYMGG